MKTQTKRLTALISLTCVFAFSTVGAVTAFAAEENAYYVCFSNQNYSLRNANKMVAADGEYILENVSLSSADDFYVTDNSGTRWYASDDKPLSVEDAGVYDYDIKFSPDAVYSSEEDGWAQTDCKITYRFNVPEVYSVNINGEDRALTYNPYHTAYDLYYISSVQLNEGDVISYGGEENKEEHTISSNGYYRILFTPDKEKQGNIYKFDKNGNYDSGSDYVYNIYVEDAPIYYVVYRDGAIAGTPDTQINGKNAYLMERYEKNASLAEYRASEFFVSERDTDVKYCIYELTPTDSYNLIDDDNDGDTDYSKLRATDAGWYSLSLTDNGSSYVSVLAGEEKHFGGWYVAGDFNGYGFDGEGKVDIDEKFLFKEVEDGDDDYDSGFKQFVLYLTVTEKDLKDDDVEFYITDGKTKYKNLSDYISLNRAGKYKILFSEEHLYGRRNYRYTLEEEDKINTELTVSTAEQFIKFARDCSASADYSVNLTVYLAKDIDFKDVTFVPVQSFSGKFMGQNHVLKNVTYSDGDEYNAIFSVVTRTGVIDRLEIENADLGGKNCDFVGVVGKNYGTVSNVSVTGKAYGRNYVGGIVAYNGASVIDEDSATIDSNDVISRAEIKNCTANVSVTGTEYVGGICGFNSGNVFASDIQGNVSGLEDKASRTAIINLGGIAGYSSGEITGCLNAAKVAGGADSLYIGGIAGLCTGNIYFSFNRADVSGYKYVSGVCGYYGTVEQNQDDLNSFFGGMDYETFIKNYFNGTSSEDPDSEINGTVNYCINYGKVTAVSYAGGVLGNSSVAGLKILNSASTADISVTAGSYAGGIAGNFTGGEIKGCLSYGLIEAKGTGGGNYAGGIVGYGNNVYYCMSAATVKGGDFVGGIAGYAVSDIIGCYTNVLIDAEDATNKGAIAGFAKAYNTSLNTFGDSVKGNYYVGAVDGLGGIHGMDYAVNYNYAATEISSSALATDGMLSVELCEHFSREYWQGGNGTKLYPTLYYFEKVNEFDEFGDEQRWNELFNTYASDFGEVARSSARLTYTVIFKECNKDKDPYDEDGNLCKDDFKIISIVRVSEGQIVEVPELQFAELNSNGQYVYEGNEARYFVRFPQATETYGNNTVYAEYHEIVNSLTDENNTVFVEGDFYKGAEVELIRVGDYYTLKFTYDGAEIYPESVTLKMLVGDGASGYSVFTVVGGQEEVKAQSEASGKYVQFVYSSGQYFRLEQNDGANLPFWAWLLIGIGGTLIVCGIGAFVACLVLKKKKATPAEQPTGNAQEASEAAETADTSKQE